MRGNRPNDVCALCDTPITESGYGYAGLHLYLGPGWVHGGGCESIAVHAGCAWLGDLDEDAPVRPHVVARMFGTVEAA